MKEPNDKRIRQCLLGLSGMLVLAGTLGFGVTPFLDAKRQSYDATTVDAQLRYYDLRRQMDLGALQWELARGFLVNNDILAQLGADVSARADNQEHYHNNILSAWTLMRNAARGNDDTGAYRGLGPLVSRPRRPDEEIRSDYHNLVMEATARNNRVIAEREQSRRASERLGVVKSIVHTLSLIANCLGLAIGVFAVKYD